VTTDFSAITEQLILRFWGEPTSKTKIEWRWGSGGSRSYKVEEHVWFDHEMDEGGGTIDLVMREEGLQRSEALVWLEEQGLIEGRSGRTGGQQRQEAPFLTDEPSAPEQPPVNTPEAVMKAVKGYRYANRDGDPLYEVIRYHFLLPDGSWVIDPKTGNPKKTFRQRRPDGKGGHIWNLDGVGHTIYRHKQVEMAIEAGWTVALMEGEKDVETLEGFGAVATTNSGGAKHWTPEMAAIFKGADVVIFTDNDDAGREGAEIKARSLRGIARRIRVLDLAQHVPDFPAKWDVTDWVERLGGTHERLVEIMNALPDWRPAEPASKFGAVGLDGLQRKDLQHEFLIDDFLDRQGVVMIPGASGSGKTFLVVEVGMCVALAQDFWGMKTKPGLVVYQAGEGKQGVAKRLEGWMLDRGIEPSANIPFRMLTKRVNLFVDDKDTDELIAECRALSEYFQQPMRILFIDTFNKAITGANENAGQDMSKVLARLERMSVELDCAVAVPIHKSAEGKMRGHTSLTGDVANVLDVTELQIKDQNGRIIRTAQLHKNKDGEKGPPHRFVLRQVVTGMRTDGKPITTCVVDRPNGDEEALVSEGKLSLNQTLFLQTLKDAIDIDGEDAPSAVTGVPKGRRVVKYKAFEARLRNKWPFTTPEHEVEKRNREFERSVGDAGKRLVAFGYVERDNATKVIWWTGKQDRPVRRQSAALEPAPPLPPDVAQEIKDMEVPF